MAVLTLLTAVMLLLGCTSGSEAALEPQTPSYAEDTISCEGLCGFTELRYLLPCYQRECELRYDSDNSLGQVFTVRDKQDSPNSVKEVPAQYAQLQKRVKEVWEGPAPADINH